MKTVKRLAFFLLLVLGLTACGTVPGEQQLPGDSQGDVIAVHLSDDGISVDGAPVGADNSAAVYAACDIVYYEAGKDFTYGEGSEDEAHSADTASAHTVVHITKPGTYCLSGALSRGQQPPERPERGEHPGGFVPGGAGALSAEFRIGDGANQFSNVFPIE